MGECPLCDNQRWTEFSRVDGRGYGRCPECGLVFLLPAHHLDGAAERKRYCLHENDPDDAGYRQFLRRLTDCLLPKLDPGAQGLDFGSGPGPTLSVIMAEHGYPMNHYDPLFSPDSSVLAQSYDFVTCSEAAEHFRKPREIWGQLDRLLAANAWLAVMTSFVSDSDHFADWHYRRDPTHVVFYSRQSMDWIAGWMGWQVEYPRETVTLFHKG